MNRLAQETSPYLRQHADNPVDWYPFGDEALAAAALLDRPLFISIGYSACHWCHVMAHESFEDESVAARLNASFISIKVDREERPDLDAIYMEAVQLQNGNGGWPMTVFCTPDGRPFYTGTYFPKEPRGPVPSFAQLVDAIADAWQNRRLEVFGHAEDLTEGVEERLAPLPGAGGLPDGAPLVARAVERFAALFDEKHGGIGEAPKFPQPSMLELLLRPEAAATESRPTAIQMLEKTLAEMAAGGIYDHLGGGFHRYSVDRQWLVPHFEKMLYDQAGLARLYLHAFLATGDERWRQVATETIDYVLRDLSSEEGGFYSAEDADSEGEEGRFYVWSREQFDEVLGPSAEAAREHYQLRGVPNFEGRFILHLANADELPRSAVLEAARLALLEARAERVRPALDDKVLVEWNAMTIAALAEAGAALGRADYLARAEQAAGFLLRSLRRADGRWLRAYAGGRAQHLGLATDYAWLVECFVRLYEATGTAVHLREAVAVADGLIELFGEADGGFLLTGDDAPALVVRPRDSYDGVVPSASSVAANALYRLGALTGTSRYVERAEAVIGAGAGGLAHAPFAFSHLIQACLLAERGALEIVTPGREDLAHWCQEQYLPDAVLAWGERTESPLFYERPDGLAYVCRGGICLAPVQDIAALSNALEAARFLRS